MRQYSWDEWGITPAEYEILLQAVDQGVVTPRQVEDRRLLFKWGELGAYKFTHDLDFRHRFHTDIEPMRDSVSQVEFEAICLDVLKEYPHVIPSRFDWAEFHFTFPSHSRKSANGGSLYFDGGGSITGKTMDTGHPTVRICREPLAIESEQRYEVRYMHKANRPD